jgi:hypothetical protein
MDGPNFAAPPPDSEPPAVDAFLSAVDHTMNSNTLLLTATCDVPITAGNRQDVLPAFLRSACSSSSSVPPTVAAGGTTWQTSTTTCPGNGRSCAPASAPR